MSDRELLEALVFAVDGYLQVIGIIMGGSSPGEGLLLATGKDLEDSLAAAKAALREGRASLPGTVPVDEDQERGTFTFFHEDGPFVVDSSDVVSAFVKAREVVDAHKALVEELHRPTLEFGPRLGRELRMAGELRALELLVYPERRDG